MRLVPTVHLRFARPDDVVEKLTAMCQTSPKAASGIARTDKVTMTSDAVLQASGLGERQLQCGETRRHLVVNGEGCRRRWIRQ